jgi:hypothetical protein
MGSSVQGVEKVWVILMGRPLVAGSISSPIEDKLSAYVSRKSKLEMLPPFLYMMNAFRQTASTR